MTFAHIAGLPVEESALALAPAGAALLTGVVVVGRSKGAAALEWLRRAIAARAGDPKGH